MYLPYSLTGNAKALSDFFKRQTVLITEVQNAPLALRERVQDVFQRAVEIGRARKFPLAAGYVVQEILGVIFVHIMPSNSSNEICSEPPTMRKSGTGSAAATFATI